MNNSFDKVKEFLQSKIGRHTIFFGFYLIFFILVLLLVKNLNTSFEEKNKKNENPSQVHYQIDCLNNNSYLYEYEIIYDNEKIVFKGIKGDNDFREFPHAHFLNIYNLNQILKNAKIVETNTNMLMYEIGNQELNDLYQENEIINDNINTIKVFVDTNYCLKSFEMDLSNYIEDFSSYQIKGKYEVIE